MKPLTQEDIIKQKVERFTQVFTRVNSVLTLRPIKVRTEHSFREAPAWSTADTVTFNSRLIGELNDARSIASIKGLNFHEDAHILYTPRTGSEIWRWVEEAGVFHAYNCLEDQRIETMLVGRYPSIVDWLTATMAVFLIESDHFDQAYPLLRGRRYLPASIRGEARRAYKHPEKVDEIIEIVDAYRSIIYPRDTDAAKVLIQRFHDLLIESPEGGEGGDEGGQEGPVWVIPNPHGHGDRPSEGHPTSASRPATEKEQERDQRNANNSDKGDDLDDDDLDDENLDESDDSDEDGDDSDGDGSDEGDEGDDDVDGASGANDGDDSSDNGANKGGNSAGNSGDPMFSEMLDDLLEDILDENAEEIENIIRQIAGLPSLGSNNSKQPKTISWKAQQVTGDTLQAARSFGRELERVRVEHDPAWVRQTPSGKLNALRAARGDDYSTIYDSWSMGHDDVTEIECVVALDISGSMSNKADAAYQAMYAIKRALDRVDAKTTVMVFGSNSYTLYNRDEKADLTVRNGGVGGGTQPLQAVTYATKLLAETDKPIRIFIAITDGEWFHAEEAEELIRKMRRAGVLTALAFIPYSSHSPVDRHECETVVKVTDVSDVVVLARELVRAGISRRLLVA